MKRPRHAACWLTPALVLALAPVFPSAISAGSADALPVSASFYAAVGKLDCVPGEAPPGSICYTGAARTSVRGLGGVEFTAHGVVLDPAGPCPGAKLAASFSTERGTIAFAGNAKGCVKAVGHGDYDATISGTGAFAGASGSATVVHQANDNWVVTGTVTAPAVTFDLTPPKLAGLVNQTVKAKEGKRPTKVRFAVTANDSVGGKLRAACTPASGTAFRVGRTRVTCTATDRSGSTATGSFTVTVR